MTPSHPPFKPPRYVINPAADRPLMWAPEVYQLILGHRNRSYANSLWLGTGWNLLALPERAVKEWLWPLFSFRLRRVFFATIAIPLTVMGIFWHGITGRLSAVNVTPEQMMSAMVLSRHRARAAVENGHNQAVIDTETLPGTAASHDH